MEIPTEIEVKETRTSYMWFDKDGILCTVSKKDAPDLSPEEYDKNTKEAAEFIGDKKCCILIDAKHTKPSSSSQQKKAAEILDKTTLALAIIVHNPVGRMIVNLFVGLKKPSYPLKIFKPGEEGKAKKWLLKHKDNG